MPQFPSLSPTTGGAGKQKITPGQIDDPTDFRHIVHVRPNMTLNGPKQLEGLFQGKIKPAMRPQVAMLPPDEVRFPGGGIVAPKPALRERVLWDRPQLPYLQDLQARQAEAENALLPPPLPQRIGSLEPAPARELPSPMFRPIPPRREDKPRPAAPAVQEEPVSLPAATAEARGASRVRDAAAAIERGERPLMDTLGAARFL
ncbi:hypothetical protein ACERNI_12365 [Camelimonas sp. ID_303_24]